MLVSTLPKTDAERAALARSKQATDIRWVPVRDLPTFTRQRGHIVLKAGEEITGFPYSSTEKTDKFITENVLIESFLSAIPNPYSKLYQPGHGAFHANNLGMVCNGLVRYAFGIKERISTKKWFSIPGMRMVAAAGEYTAEDVRLLDVLYVFCPERKHVALITDILRDESGKVVEIEVSEATRPLSKRVRYPVDVYFEKYKLFSLTRYDKLEEVPPLDTAVDSMVATYDTVTRPRIAVDNGDKSNYLLGDEVVISVYSDADDVVVIERNGEEHMTLNVADVAVIPLKLDRGYYTARLKNAGGSVEFAVCGAVISHTVKDGMITVNADPCDENSEIHYLDYRVRGEAVASLDSVFDLTDDEKASGCITRPLTAEGENFKVYFKNKYGVWVHPMTKIFQ